MQRKSLPMVIGSVLGVFLLLFCLAGVSEAAPKKIKVSGVISLTGKMAGQGVQLKEAYEILVEKVNAEGGIYVKKYDKKLPVEFRAIDDESDQELADIELTDIDEAM